MKKISWLSTFLFLQLLINTAHTQKNLDVSGTLSSDTLRAKSAAILSDTSSMDSSAVFQVQSTTQGILIPRMGTVQREAIANPANGLLVYDNETHSFWFHRMGAWEELAVGDSTAVSTYEIVDTDEDTKVTVEQHPDEDTIRFIVAGYEYGKIDGKVLDIGSPEGSLYIGKGAGKYASGDNNLAAGKSAGRYNTGDNNTILGANAGTDSLSAGGITFVGAAAGKSNTNGSFNTFLGASAGESNTVGNNNTFIGLKSGFSNSAGNHNIFIGSWSGYNNSAGNHNVAVGDSALFSTGQSNHTALGHAAGKASTGENSTFVGYRAGLNSSGDKAVIIGHEAGIHNASQNNTIVGFRAGQDTITGGSNTFIGALAGNETQSGSGNTFLGSLAGRRNTTADLNTFIGGGAGRDNTTGGSNTFVGSNAGRENQTGTQNTFIGRASGFNNRTGSDNTAIGRFSGKDLISGHSNTFLGAMSGERTSTGSDNVYIGYATGYFNASGNKNVAIGDSALFTASTTSRITAVGHAAGMSNQDEKNTFLGFESGRLSSGTSNLFAGYQAGIGNSGNDNTILGADAGTSALSGNRNVFVGTRAGEESLEASDNTFVGTNAGRLTTDATQNTFVGKSAGEFNLTGGSNTFMGFNAGNQNSTGSQNVYLGNAAGLLSSSGNRNVIIGFLAGANQTTGSSNTVIGHRAGLNVNSDYNVYIGNKAAFMLSSGNNNVVIGDSAFTQNTGGFFNTIIGAKAGASNASNGGNTMLGYHAGFNSTGISNVFLGKQAGFSETGDQKLYISNGPTTEPLIYGDFFVKTATIHGELGINTKNPDREITVFDTDDDGDAAINLKATNSSQRELLIAVNQGSGGIISMQTNNDLQFRTNGSSRMFIRNDGHVGIGSLDARNLLTLRAADNPENGPILSMLGSSTDQTESGRIRFLESTTTNNYRGGYIHYDGSLNRLFIGVHNDDDGNISNDMNAITIHRNTADVGLGVTTPTEKLTVFNGSVFIRSLGGVDSNRGFMLGESTAPTFGMVYDGAGGGGNNRMHFKEMITDTTAIMTMKGNGNVGIGDEDPDYLLEVNGSVGKPGGGLWQNSSDRRLKQDIRPFKDGLSSIQKIQPVSYRYNDLSGYDTSVEYVGVIAQELQEVAPYMVGTYQMDGEEYLKVDNSAMMYMLINAVREMSDTIEGQQKEIDRLRKAVESGMTSKD